MNLYYISPRDMRKNRADPVHTMYSCKAFSDLGWEVTLVTPLVLRKEWKKKKSEIWALYNDMEPCFRIIELPTMIRDEGENRIFARLMKFSCFLVYYLLNIRRLNADSVIYAHCYISVLPAVLLKKLGFLKAKLFYEKAEFIPGKKSHKFIINNMDGIIAINDYILKNTRDTYKIDQSRLIKLPFTSQSAQLNALRSNIDQSSARRKLGLDANGTIITYSGKIPVKSIEVRYILEASRNIHGRNLTFLFVGGTESAVRNQVNYCQSRGITNAKFVGYQTLANLYLYILASDVLVSYYDTFQVSHVTQQVPAKMSVYLYSGKPLILADLPSLREWWSEEHVFYVPPDKPELLAQKVEHVLEHPAEASEKVTACERFAEENTYETAYKYVSDFLHRRCQLSHD